MVGVAQLVRAPGCGPGGHGFKSHHSPKSFFEEACTYKASSKSSHRLEA
jgi:hypothetical protein